MKLISWLSYTLGPGLLITHSAFASVPNDGNRDEYVFEEALLRGSPLGKGSLARFNKANNLEIGIYQVDLYMNNHFIDRIDLKFTQQTAGVQACFSLEQLAQAGIADKALAEAKKQTDCQPLEILLPGNTQHFDYSLLRFDLGVPQSFVKQVPRGYVDPKNLNVGDSIGFSNYNLNQYHVAYNRNGVTQNTDSTYLGLTNGVNAGMWRLRQQGSFRYDNNRGGNWTTTRVYAQRALPSLRSEITLGEGFSSGQFFSSLGFRGVTMATDDRMLPDSLRGYAPVVRGIAKTNANVTVYQNDRPIYQTAVSAGQFEITDLSATNFGGDLTIIIAEADGSTSSFRVPFSSVPESLRPGFSRYSFSSGQIRDVGNGETFSELTYQYGISNALTANGGLRLASGYQGVMLGGVFAHYIGALGFDTTYSSAQLPNDEHQDGWMVRASFSRTFQPTGTTLSLAGYRYSTEGYRDLGDVIGVRATSRGETWQSGSYQQRSRVEMSMNQSLQDYGSLYFTASSQDYRDGRSRDNQLQLGYATLLWNQVNVNLSVSRQTTGGSTGSGNFEDPITGMPIESGLQTPAGKETLAQLSLSFPLGSSPSAPYVSIGAIHSNSSGTNYQTSLSGVTGEDQSASYSLDFSRSQRNKENTWSGSLQQRLPVTSLSGSASLSTGYWQASGSARGAVAVHGGGVTLGPYLSETFALVEAKGAEGAKVMYGQGASIDRFGYALVPTLTPYRYNTISLDPQGMDFKTELQDGERRIAPYAGSAVKVTFRTLNGYPLLITIKRPDTSIVPMGANVYNRENIVVGMVGQAGQAYLRADERQGKLTIKWGDGDHQRCILPYDLDGVDDKQPLIAFDALCANDMH